jgi:hypothetical protein
MEINEYIKIRDMRPLRTVVGENWVVDEVIKKERKTKNTVTHNLVRKATRNLVLECGHLLPATQIQKEPKRILCWSCGEDLHHASTRG